MVENNNIPQGFEKMPEKGTIQYRVGASSEGNKAPTVNFRGRPGGGPGRGMGQTVEKAENVRSTVIRLLEYFKKAKKLLVLLLGSVVCVTLAALVAPSLQGKAIDSIADRNWDVLYRCVGFLLIVYIANVLFTLSQSLLAARLSQSIVKQMLY